MTPKINLLYYKHILDKVIKDFFDEFNDDFRETDGIFVFCSQISRSRIKTWMRKHICDEIIKYTSVFSIMKPEYYFIIGSCFPKDNILLRFSDRSYFPEKLRNTIENGDNVKYTLRENDIEIDMEKFNFIFEEIFDELFNHRKLDRIFGRDVSRNIYFIKHTNLDCQMMFRTVKFIYGSSNIVNIHKNNSDTMKDVMYSVNEDVDKYIQNKKELVKTEDFEYINREIRQYIDNCIKETLNG